MHHVRSEEDRPPLHVAYGLEDLLYREDDDVYVVQNELFMELHDLLLSLLRAQFLRDLLEGADEPEEAVEELAIESAYLEHLLDGEEGSVAQVREDLYLPVDLVLD